MAPFPFPHLNEIREKYMFSITPFSPLGSASLDESSDEVGGMSPKGDKVKSSSRERPASDEDIEMDDDEDFGALTCFGGLLPSQGLSPTRMRPPSMYCYTYVWNCRIWGVWKRLVNEDTVVGITKSVFEYLERQ